MSPITPQTELSRSTQRRKAAVEGVTRRGFLSASALLPLAIQSGVAADAGADVDVGTKLDFKCPSEAPLVERRELERVTPESVGVPSSAIEALMDTLETADYTEPHSIMIMRHGKVCAEGWWAPYTQGVPHLLWSLTKTYTGTAVGIAHAEGLLNLDDPVIKYFPDYAALDPGEYIKKMRIRDVLRMASGKAKPHRSNKADWRKHFFLTPFNAEPGTTFQYGCEDSHILMAIVKKVSGLGLHDYLKPRLFDKIGISSGNLKWIYLPDGSEVGCGGLYATTEDSLRLMQLYLQDGVWEGERILAHDYVAQATSRQIANKPKGKGFGYGYQMWMGSREGSYFGIGALGQTAIAVPDLDMVVVYYQAGFWAPRDAVLPPVNSLEDRWKAVSDIYNILLPAVKDGTLPENKEASAKLARRMSHLSLGNAVAKPCPPMAGKVSGRPYVIKKGEFTLRTHLWEQTTIDGPYPNEGMGMDQFVLTFERPDVCTLNFKERGKDYTLEVGLDGVRRLNSFNLENTCIDRVVVDGVWLSGDTFRLNARWIETCYHISIKIVFEGNGAVISLIEAKGDYDSNPLREGNALAEVSAK